MYALLQRTLYQLAAVSGIRAFAAPRTADVECRLQTH